MKTNIPYIETPSGITLFVKGRPFKLETEDPRYSRAVELLGCDDETGIVDLLTNTNAATTLLKEMATVVDTQDIGNLKFEFVKNSMGAVQEVSVLYKLQPLPEVLQKKLATMYSSGIREFGNFTNFLDNILANPRESSREELYSFLSVTEMPITPTGNFIAYKAVNKDGYSHHGNKHTRVLSGTTDEDGRIYNAPGEVIEVVVEDVDPDRNAGCSYGLHAGAFQYAADFAGSRGKIYAVEINPKDVVSVPLDCSCRKCRMSKYKVLNEVENPYLCAEVNVTETAVESTSAPLCSSIEQIVHKAKVDVIPSDPAKADKLRDRVSVYLKNKGGSATVRQITKRLYHSLPGLNAHSCLSLLMHLGFHIECREHTGSCIVHS